MFNILLLSSSDVNFQAQAFISLQKAVSMENSMKPSGHCTGVLWVPNDSQLPKVQEEDRTEQNYNEISGAVYYKNKQNKKQHHQQKQTKKNPTKQNTFKKIFRGFI